MYTKRERSLDNTHIANAILYTKYTYTVGQESRITRQELCNVVVVDIPIQYSNYKSAYLMSYTAAQPKKADRQLIYRLTRSSNTIIKTVTTPENQ